MKIKIPILLLLFISNLNCIPDEGTFGYSAVVIALRSTSDEIPIDSFDFIVMDTNLNILPLDFEKRNYIDEKVNYWSSIKLEPYIGRNLFLNMVVRYKEDEIEIPVDTFSPIHEHQIIYSAYVSQKDTMHFQSKHTIPLNIIDPGFSDTVFFDVYTHSTLRE